MCGFAGVLAEQQYLAVQQRFLQQMGASIQHRGPDDQGIFVNPNNTLGMVHRRLAILDLSAAGHQPMHSADGRYTLAFNGEIYNHQQLRSRLEKAYQSQWQGHSDTETLLEGFRHWGVEQTIKACVGMFAIALWDHTEQSLTLVRDRAGEKPLYYGFANGVFLFGSELKALKTHPAFDNKLSLPAIALMLRHKYIPAPHTVYKHYSKLLPGTMLTVKAGQAEPQYRVHRYWSFANAAQHARLSPFNGSEPEAQAALERQLQQAVSEQMIADVPLGAFLSGGTDSSLIAALMQSQSTRPVKTYTVGFNVPEYNEAEHAKAVAKHLGCDHTEIYVDEQDALNVVPKLVELYDEPFADSSQIPTYLIAKEARKHVTVALSGDAGDELFCGYSRYFRAAQFYQTSKKIPPLVFSVIKKSKGFFLAEVWQQLEQVLGLGQSKKLSTSLAKLADTAHLTDLPTLYTYMLSDWKTLPLNNHADQHSTLIDTDFTNDQSAYEWMMLADSQSYLPDDVLVKVDRAAMAVSLETRVPMLDHRVIELALAIPQSYKVKGDQGKWLLKNILYQYVPQRLLDRPKTGFGVPVDHWLKGPLKEWAENLLNEHKLKQQGLFDSKMIRKYWQEHQQGQQNWQYPLWNLLILLSWLEAQ